MDIIWFLLIGLIAGWIAAHIMKGRGFGLFGGMGVIVGIVAIIAILAISYFVFERMQMQEMPKEEDSPGIILELNGGSGNTSSAN